MSEEQVSSEGSESSERSSDSGSEHRSPRLNQPPSIQAKEPRYVCEEYIEPRLNVDVEVHEEVNEEVDVEDDVEESADGDSHHSNYSPTPSERGAPPVHVDATDVRKDEEMGWLFLQTAQDAGDADAESDATVCSDNVREALLPARAAHDAEDADDDRQALLPPPQRKGNQPTVSKNKQLLDRLRYWIVVYPKLLECKRRCILTLAHDGFLAGYDLRKAYAATCETDQKKKAFVMEKMNHSTHVQKEPGPDGRPKLLTWPAGLIVKGLRECNSQSQWCMDCFQIVFEVRGKLEAISSL
jgi:hypothetical protein